MDRGFVQGKSDNLPRIDSLSEFSFLGSNPDFIGAETRNIKTASSSRESYGDNAVGYVQVKREGEMCTVKGKITPEHRVRKQPYEVVVLCNERNETIRSVNCNGCAASLGGCKHAIAFLMWIHRRSEEPATTSVTNYWRKSKLSQVGTSQKFIRAKEIGKSASSTSSQISIDQSFSQMITRQSSKDSVLGKYYKNFNDVEKLSVHHLCEIYFVRAQVNIATTVADDFLQFCSSEMTADACNLAEKQTQTQSDSPLWHELRYCRITASKAHEVAKCRTLEGSLVEGIFGAKKIKDTAAMKRGRTLESNVIKVVQNQINEKVVKCGLLLSANYPVIGASPDGLTKTYAVEIKCPASEKATKNCITEDDKIGHKYMAQVQLQMYFSNRKRAAFCVAEPNFETSKNVKILYVPYDEKFCLDLLEKCTLFWKTAIFSKLKQNYM